MISNPNHTTPTKKSGVVESGVQVASSGQVQQQSNTTNSSASNQQTWTGLDLSRMKLRAVSPSIAIYSFLTELYLQFNNLSVLPVDMFSSLTNLRVLDLSYNAIVYLPSEISHLLHLHTLLLINNSIRELPVEMGKLFRMDKLAIEGNPLQDPPQDIIDKGAQAVVAYLRDRMPGTSASAVLAAMTFHSCAFIYSRSFILQLEHHLRHVIG
jgi:CCR4-NOT transcription complex subunit 6